MIPPDAATPRKRAKIAAAAAALKREIKNDMTVGLGSGSTAEAFIHALGVEIARGLRLRAVASSQATATLAQAVGVELASLDDLAPLDIAVDGCDEIDPDLNMIKGGGGCLLREKIIARAARRFVALCDASKAVKRLGAFPLPVEIAPFAPQTARRAILDALRQDTLRQDTLKRGGLAGGLADADIALRRTPDGQPFITDNGNLILDCRCRRIDDPQALESRLAALPGCIEIGLFTRECDAVIIGAEDGSCSYRARS